MGLISTKNPLRLAYAQHLPLHFQGEAFNLSTNIKILAPKNKDFVVL